MTTKTAAELSAQAAVRDAQDKSSSEGKRDPKSKRIARQLRVKQRAEARAPKTHG